MITINMSVLPTTDEETSDALDILVLVTKSLVVKGISVSLSINTYGEDEEEHKEDNG